MDSKDEDEYSLHDWNSDSENNSFPQDKVDSNSDDLDTETNTKPNTEANLDPILNSVFQSPNEAFDFYVDYARIKGFDIRKNHKKTNTKGVVKNVDFVCNREGFRRAPKEASKSSRRSRDETKCGCKARLRIAHDVRDDIYRVTYFEANHNHPLETPGTSHRLKCNRYMSASHKALLSHMSDVGLRTCKSIDWLEYMEGGSGKLSFTRKDGYNYLSKDKMKLVRHGDVNTALSFLDGLQVKDEDFIFKYTTDESDKSLTRLFWADGFSKAEYRLFGDVVLFDSTYKTIVTDFLW